MTAEQIDTLFADLLVELAQSPYAASLAEQRAHLSGPLRIAVAGRVKAGKSTLLNALVGERLAPTDAGECTKVVTWYRHGPTYRVTGLQDGASLSLPFDRTNGQLTIDLGDDDPLSFDRLDVSWPSGHLTDLTLIDTPGIDSVNRHYSDRSIDLLAGNDTSSAVPVRPDAVLYLMTHAHQRDLALFDSFADRSIVGSGLTNAIGVLSRSDEIGVGSRDTMEVAEAVAQQYRNDPRIATRCQDVIPLAGLLAETAVTLREEEFRKLTDIAAINPTDLQLALLSVDRFVSTPLDRMPSATERIHLLDRFGAFGLRLSCQLIARGAAPDSSSLAAALRERSGLTRLRLRIESVFGHRAQLLRRQGALAAIADVAPHCSPVTRDRIAELIDRFAANDHEHAEVVALNALRIDRCDVDNAVAKRAERILGGHGPASTTRLGLAPDAEVGEIDAAARVEHAYWANLERQAAARLATRRLARTATRSCEGIIATPGNLL